MPASAPPKSSGATGGELPASIGNTSVLGGCSFSSLNLSRAAARSSSVPSRQTPYPWALIRQTHAPEVVGDGTNGQVGPFEAALGTFHTGNAFPIVVARYPMSLSERMKSTQSQTKINGTIQLIISCGCS